MTERDRPLGGPSGSDVVPDVVIVSPRTSDSPIPTPGPLPVRIEVTETSGLLEAVGLRVIRSPATMLADTSVAFDSTVGDTSLTVTLLLEALPTNTQLNLVARALVLGRSTSSDEVAITVIDCTGQPIFCP